MCAKRFGAPAVEIDARDVLSDRFGSFDGGFWVGRTDLINEIGFFDRVGGEHGARFATVRDDASVGWIGLSERMGTGTKRGAYDRRRVLCAIWPCLRFRGSRRGLRHV